MRKLFFIIGFFCGAFSLASGYAQQPEEIYGKNKVLKTNEYYLQQLDLWKKETDKDSQNANAWFNYYKASRNAYIVGEEKDSLNSKGVNRFARLEKIVTSMEKNVPTSFEYHYVKWMNGNNDLSLFPFLEKAYTINPKRTEPLLSMAYYYEIKGDYTSKKKFAAQYYNSGDFSAGLLIYGTNLLSGLEKEAIILTEGDKDTDAMLLLQQGKETRTDVQLINLNLLMIKEYRNRIFIELEIPEWKSDPLKSDYDYDIYKTSIVDHISNNKKGRPVYVAASVSERFAGPASLYLYPTGLALRYSKTSFDNQTMLIENFEKKYQLDYLIHYPSGDMSEANVHQFNINYLSALFMLNDYYVGQENKTKADYYQNLAEHVARDGDGMQVYNAFFHK